MLERAAGDMSEYYMIKVDLQGTKYRGCANHQDWPIDENMIGSKNCREHRFRE